MSLNWKAIRIIIVEKGIFEFIKIKPDWHKWILYYRKFESRVWVSCLHKPNGTSILFIDLEGF